MPQKCIGGRRCAPDPARPRTQPKLDLTQSRENPRQVLRCVQQCIRYKPLRLSTLFDTTLRKDIYGPLRAERSVKFLGYDLQTSHNALLIMFAAMFTCFNVCAENIQIALIITQPIWNSHFSKDYYLFSSLQFFRQNVDQKYVWLWTRPPQFQSHLSSWM